MNRLFPFRRRQSETARHAAGPIPVPAGTYQRALTLINQQRRQGDSPLLGMGENDSAQRHAEHCLDMGLASQWSSDGLKPYMRYSRAGGYQANASFSWQNASSAASGLANLEREIEDGVHSLFRIVGHRTVLMDRVYRRVNIGIASSRNHFVLYLTLEGDWIEYRQVPTITGSILQFAGRSRNGVRLNAGEDLSAEIWYDPLPQPATLGQLLRVNAYDYGTIVAGLRPSPPPGYQWDEDRATAIVERLTQPGDIPADAPAPSDFNQRMALMQQAYYNNEAPSRLEVTYPLVTCGEWSASKGSFSVAADIGNVLAANGPGVYTLALWAPMGQREERTNISRYSMLVNAGGRDRDREDSA